MSQHVKDDGEPPDVERLTAARGHATAGFTQGLFGPILVMVRKVGFHWFIRHVRSSDFLRFLSDRSPSDRRRLSPLTVRVLLPERPATRGVALTSHRRQRDFDNRRCRSGSSQSGFQDCGRPVTQIRVNNEATGSLACRTLRRAADPCRTRRGRRRRRSP